MLAASFTTVTGTCMLADGVTTVRIAVGYDLAIQPAQTFLGALNLGRPAEVNFAEGVVSIPGVFRSQMKVPHSEVPLADSESCAVSYDFWSTVKVGLPEHAEKQEEQYDAGHCA